MRSIFSRPDAKATMSERRNEYWLEEIMFCPLGQGGQRGGDVKGHRTADLQVHGGSGIASRRSSRERWWQA